jgi:hypothetical protein
MLPLWHLVEFSTLSDLRYLFGQWLQFISRAQGGCKVQIPGNLHVVAILNPLGLESAELMQSLLVHFVVHVTKQLT